MMKNSIFLITICLLFSCKNTTKEKNISENEDPFATVTWKDFNTRVADEEEGGEMLLGKINCKGLQEPPFNNWFLESYNAHVLDSKRIDSIKPLLKNVTLKIFMGSWCEDSQREIPALHKILEATEFNEEEHLKMFAMTHDKVTPQEFEKDLNVTFVPSIIFYREGKELNRIVEFPQETLEKDILKILQGKPYIPYTQ